jgi:hypothetical protein
VSKHLTSKDLNRIGSGRTNIDRKCEQEARPSSGSATPAHKLTASQSNGAGSSSPNADTKKNGMNTILGLAAPEKAPAFERTAAPKSRTPDPKVRAAKAHRFAIENGNADPRGGYKK